MAKGDNDDILLGAPVLATKEARDTDGDGVSDVQEELEGTNPTDASDRPSVISREDADPRGDLDRATLDPAIDPRAALPDGMSVDTGLTGLTGLDGSPIQTGPSHDGVGEDSILDGRLGTDSPLDVQRNPLGSTASGTGPSGADLGFRAPNSDLYGAGDGGGAEDFELPTQLDTPAPPPADPSPPPPPPPDGEGNPPPPPDSDGNPKPDPAPDVPPQVMTDPDAGGTSGVSGGGRLAPGTIDGGDTDFVEGYGGGPQIEGDAPAVRYRDLVTDGGDDSGNVETDAGAPRGGTPDAPVVRTINPDAGVFQPPISGGPPPSGTPGDDDLGLTGVSSAATATVAVDPGTAGLTTVGSGAGGGISSTIAADGEGGDDPPPDPDDPDDDAGTALTGRAAASTADAPETAVDAFATSFLHETSLPAPDLVASGLASDLSADVRPAIDEPARAVELDPGGAELLEGSLPDDDVLDG